MVSAIDRAKRALVALLKHLARVYGVTVDGTRDSADKDVRRAYRQVSRRAHPDHGGNEEHQKSLNNAYDVCQALRVLKYCGPRSTPAVAADA
jgi:hypothetical protein